MEVFGLGFFYEHNTHLFDESMRTQDLLIVIEHDAI